MKAQTLRRAAAFAAAVTVLFVLGCLNSATEPKVTKPRYPATTNKDIVVSNLVLSYKDHNIDQYTKLLHLDYIWYNQNADVLRGAPAFYTRDQDIAQTRNLFLAADHNGSVSSDMWVDRL
ncbi:MAG: hypothetical protein ABR899_09460, partial [Candidatus Krumholzibacteriaceae bacterium]